MYHVRRRVTISTGDCPHRRYRIFMSFYICYRHRLLMYRRILLSALVSNSSILHYDDDGEGHREVFYVHDAGALPSCGCFEAFIVGPTQ